MPSMPSLLLLPVLLAALPAVRAATCTRSVTALTSACDDQCLEGRPCVAFAAGAACDESWSTFGTCKNESSTGCTFECFTNGPTDFAANGVVEFSDYTFLIPFGSTESKSEASWSSGEASWADAQLASGGDETDELPSLSNNDFEHIEALDLLDTTTSVTIAGGTSVFGVRGRVAKVVLATQLLVAETQLTSVTLANLQPEEAPPQNTFPPQLKHFGMPNCLLGAYPEDILLMDSLVSLDLSKNYLDDFPVKFSRPTLETLDLSVNTLVSFDGDLPNLTSLDLANNTLSSIPDSIFAMTKLTTLNLTGNSFTDVALTSEQVTFLNNLETLKIDNFSAVSCDASLQTTVGSATVCLASGSGSGSSATATTSSGGSNTGAIVGGIIGGIVALGIVIAIAMFVYRRRHRNDEDKSRTKKTTTTGTMAHSTIGSEMRDAGSLWTDQELLSLQVNLDDIEDIRKIGVGAFGVVYLAKYRGTKLVASKRLKRDEVNWQNTQQFIAEIKLVARLDHPRVVKLVGIAWSIEADLQALFEYMENGDLRTHLENPQTPRSWDDGEKLQIAIDIVDALVYVHSFSPPLVHRDLKSRNVLLDGEYRGNLSDFGVARFRSEANTMTAGVGTGRWLAPEVIQGNCDYDQACDVFAFGVVLSEMDTHTLPYEDVRGPGGNQLADVAILQLVAAGRLLPSFTPQCPHELHELALRCMALHREERPSAVELAYALRTLQKSLRFSTGALV